MHAWEQVANVTFQLVTDTSKANIDIGWRDYSIVASQHDLVLEQANLFEHLTQQVADTAVYRFFNTGDGSHFFTSNATESAAIVQNRPDMVAEGVSFYAPTV